MGREIKHQNGRAYGNPDSFSTSCVNKNCNSMTAIPEVWMEHWREYESDTTVEEMLKKGS